jgi:hypothetical protein
MNAAEEILDRLDLAIVELKSAASAAVALAKASVKETEAKLSDGDEWKRLPKSPNRCPVSNWGRTTLLRRATESKDPVRDMVRMKHVGKTRFYSMADVRRILAGWIEDGQPSSKP